MRKILLSVLLAGLLTTGLALALQSSVNAQEIYPGTVTQTASQELVASQARTGTGSLTSDVIAVAQWYAADVFVSVDISGTGVVTVTPQFAVNGEHWSDAKITYPSWSLTSAPPATVSSSTAVTETSSITDSATLTDTGVITNTGYTTTTTVITITNTVTQTAEFDVSGASTIASVAQQIILSADGADHVRLPIVGNQMRVKIEWSGVVTPTVDVLLRNN